MASLETCLYSLVVIWSISVVIQSMKGLQGLLAECTFLKKQLG